MSDRLPNIDLTINRFGHLNDLTPLPVRFRFVHSTIITGSAATTTDKVWASNTFRFANYSNSNSHTSALPIPKTVLTSSNMSEFRNTASSLSQNAWTGIWALSIFMFFGIFFFLLFGFFVSRVDDVEEPGMSERETRRVEYQLRNGNTKLDHIVVKVVAVAKQLDSVGKRMDEVYERMDEVHERMDGVYEALCTLTELEELPMSGMERTEGNEDGEVPDGASEANEGDSTGGERGDVGLKDLKSRLPDPVPETRQGAEVSEEGMEPDSENVEKTWRRHLRSKGYDVNA